MFSHRQTQPDFRLSFAVSVLGYHGYFRVKIF